jgi:hypothetical protein
MRKILILAVLVGAAAITAVSLANPGSGSVTANAAAKGSAFGLRYKFADPIDLSRNEADGRVLKCPKGWHPVSGLFDSTSNDVVAVEDAPASQRAWAVRVRNEGPEVSVTIGAVCVKGLPLR